MPPGMPPSPGCHLENGEQVFLSHIKRGLSRHIRCAATGALLGRLKEYVTAIITLHIQRIGDEENNVKKNNTLAQREESVFQWNPIRVAR